MCSYLHYNIWWWFEFYWNFNLIRAEDLKKKLSSSGTVKSTPSLNKVENKPPPLGYGAFLDDDEKTTVSAGGKPSPTNAPKRGSQLINLGPSGYTKEEIEVLRYEGKNQGSHVRRKKSRFSGIKDEIEVLRYEGRNRGSQVRRKKLRFSGMKEEIEVLR